MRTAGAKRVLATDSWCWSGKGWGQKASFEFARRALGSKVEDLDIDVMDLSPETIGTFDLVLFLGVLYHLQHPLLALERVASVTKECVIVETVLDRMWSRRPAMVFYPGEQLGQDWTNWWGPNEAAVEAMLRSVGFRRVRKVSETGVAGRVMLGLRALKRRKPLGPPLQQGRGVFHAWK